MYSIDLQGVCDSLVFNTKDSCLTMYRDPILWNEGQQLLGEEIKVYMNAVSYTHLRGMQPKLWWKPEPTV